MAHHCEFPYESGWNTVMVHYGIKLCEVGENCPATRCEFRYKPEDVKPCPTCHGEPNIKEPPYSCSTCDVFGIVRVDSVKAAS